MCYFDETNRYILLILCKNNPWFLLNELFYQKQKKTSYQFKLVGGLAISRKS